MKAGIKNAYLTFSKHMPQSLRGDMRFEGVKCYPNFTFHPGESIVLLPLSALKVGAMGSAGLGTRTNPLVSLMKAGVNLPVPEVAYTPHLAVRDGVNRIRACQLLGYTHIPCRFSYEDH